MSCFCLFVLISLFERFGCGIARNSFKLNAEYETSIDISHIAELSKSAELFKNAELSKKRGTSIESAERKKARNACQKSAECRSIEKRGIVIKRGTVKKHRMQNYQKKCGMRNCQESA